MTALYIYAVVATVATLACAVLAWRHWRANRPRVQHHVPFETWTKDALDMIAEPDRRRAEHMNRTLRRAEGGDEHG